MAMKNKPNKIKKELGTIPTRLICANSPAYSRAQPTAIASTPPTHNATRKRCRALFVGSEVRGRLMREIYANCSCPYVPRRGGNEHGLRNQAVTLKCPAQGQMSEMAMLRQSQTGTRLALCPIRGE